MQERVKTIEMICAEITKGCLDNAAAIGRKDYPFVPRLKVGRSYTPYQSTVIFRRDGFIDRYSGERLIFPGTLNLLGSILPNEFPWHLHGKLSESHIIYWELFPTIDHFIPVTRGGVDDETNWITTSMLRNQAKLHWTLDELGWQLYDPGDLSEWDGLMGWFLEYANAHPDVLSRSHIKRWYDAAIRIS